VEEMLQQDLELEKAALAAYHDVLKVVKDDVALRHMMESLIETETRSVEETEKLLSLKVVKMKDKEIRLKNGLSAIAPRKRTTLRFESGFVNRMTMYALSKDLNQSLDLIIADL
jgi:hypothetical protein